MLANRREELSVQRTRRAADAQDQRLADFAQRSVDRLRGNTVDLRKHRIETALQIHTMIRIADRPIELGQLVGAADHRVRDRLNHFSRRALIEFHGFSAPSAASTPPHQNTAVAAARFARAGQDASSSSVA